MIAQDTEDDEYIYDQQKAKCDILRLEVPLENSLYLVFGDLGAEEDLYLQNGAAINKIST